MRFKTTLLIVIVGAFLLCGICAKTSDYVDDAASMRMEPLLRWALDNGAWIHPQVQFRHIEGKGIGLFAQAGLAEKTIVLKVPTHLLMSSGSVTKTSKIGPLLGEYLRDLGPTNMAAVLLMHEKLNKQSFWTHFIDSMPQDFTTPIFFPDEILEILKSTHVMEWTMKRKETIRKHYDYLMDMVFSQYPDVFDTEHYTIDLFKWALSVIWSRSFTIYFHDERHPALVPLADMLNHNIPENLDGLTIGSGQNEFFVLQLKTPCHFGTELTVKYTSMPSTDRILFDYGYVIHDNPHDAIMISVPFEEPLTSSQQKLYEKYSLPREISFIASSQQIIPPQYMAALRVRVMTTEDIHKLQSENWTPTKKTDNIIELRALRAVGLQITKQLQGYDTTIKQDMELSRVKPSHIRDKDANYHRIAMEYRFALRRFLNRLGHEVGDQMQELRSGKKDQKIYQKRRRLHPDHREEL
eukprot:TRINITY_DN9988_c0_g1_i1.p1 TRINITY_DN9988_c0_g1~~TRINITY_DN9988_c0_g1_i1.p1  ORF type:complete len:466 (-),score=97.37 TRINITY_DN9988_c0_g1_i1:213-1610(-)